MVIPDRKSKVRKIVIAASYLKLLICLSAVVAILIAAVFVDYGSLLSQSIENKRLHTENAELRQQFQVVEEKLNSVEATLDRIKTFSTKLKLITAVNDPDRALNLAMGPVSKTEKAVEELKESVEQRAPASRILDEPLFKPKSLQELTAGELAREEDHDYAKLSVRLDQVAKVTQLREQGVMELWEFLQDRSALLSATPSMKPAAGWYTSTFGYRVSPYTDKPMMHEGLDIAASPGTPVYAPADGVVSFSGYDAGYGKLIVIDHGYGVETRYGHNSELHVKVGQKVRRGERIAAVGNTGRSTGPHLHYEIRVNGEPTDPVKYILEE